MRFILKLDPSSHGNNTEYAQLPKTEFSSGIYYFIALAIVYYLSDQ